MDLPRGPRRHAESAGVAARLDSVARGARRPARRALLLQNVIPWAVKKFGFNADAFVHELVDSIIGDNYPVPDRMLVHNEQIVREYLQWAMCGEPRPAGTFDLYAVEGGTAAMCYLFKSLKANRLLNPGDTIAMATPIFTPYLEMPHLEDYGLKMVFIPARQEQRWQYTDDDLKPLLDPAVKAFFVVNPGQPVCRRAESPTASRNIGKVLRGPSRISCCSPTTSTGRSCPGSARCSASFPETRWACTPSASISAARDGASASSRCTRTTSSIARSPLTRSRSRKALDKRYAPLTLEPRKLTFIDRIVADSRDVALNHTAGLSLPQQVMMTLFSLAELYDEKKVYQQACIDIVQKRVMATIDGLGHRDRSQPALRLVLRPHRLRVLAAQVRRRGRRRLGEGERASARHRVPPRRRPRHRAAQRRRLRGAGLVGPRLLRESRRRRLRQHRPCGAGGRAQLRDGVPGVAGGVARQRRRRARRAAASIEALVGAASASSRGHVLPRARDRLPDRQGEAGRLHARRRHRNAAGRRRRRPAAASSSRAK